jgi:hypothetical protein
MNFPVPGTQRVCLTHKTAVPPPLPPAAMKAGRNHHLRVKDHLPPYLDRRAIPLANPCNLRI